MKNKQFLFTFFLLISVIQSATNQASQFNVYGEKHYIQNKQNITSSLLGRYTDTTEVLKKINGFEELSYYPMHVGDKWYYKMSISHLVADSVDEIKIVSNEIIGDTLLQNKRYFIRESHGMESNIYGSSKKVFLRVDSIKGIVYKYDIDKEIMVDSLLASENDTLGSLLVNKIFINKIFNIITKSKNYSTSYVSSYDTYSWEISQNFGLTNMIHSDAVSMTKYEYKLVYAEINGKVYGDSIVVGVQKENENIPNKYLSVQNYPNPFNPTTIISFTIPQKLSGKQTTLIIYNIQGKSIKTLLNKKLLSGSYLARWNGTNYNDIKVSSGVYFYKLKVGQNQFVGKMNLLK